MHVSYESKTIFDNPYFLTGFLTSHMKSCMHFIDCDSDIEMLIELD